MLYVLCAPAPGDSERNILRIAEAMGIPTALLEAPSVAAAATLLHARAQGGPRCAVAVAAELAAALGLGAQPASNPLPSAAAACLIYGAACTQGTAAGPAVVARGYRFGDGEATPLPWRGSSFAVPEERAVPVLAAKDVDAAAVILSAGSSPVFAVASAPGPRRYLWAVDRIADVDAAIESEKALPRFLPGLLPLLIFLKQSFDDACWHAPRACARLIIDDPLLQPAYGFLRYAELAASMKRGRYGTTIGFIPWNHRRTDRSLAEALASLGPMFSLCVHGCDHTNREFAEADEDTAASKGRCALRRMSEHEQRYALGCAPIMVFPQGHFSVDALRGLQRCGFLAAVNTTLMPRGRVAGELTLRDLLSPALDRYHGFPVFSRRYPDDMIGYAFDAYVGKPVLVVEHHAVFKDGGRTLERLAASLRAMEPALEWPPLDDIVTSSCRQRRDANGWHVVFYTRRFTWRNHCATRQTVSFSKFDPASAVLHVTAGGRALPFRRENGRICFACEVDAGQSVAFELHGLEDSSTAETGARWKYRLAVLARRRLSEFRDNTLSRRPGLLRAARRMAKLMQATGS